MSCADGMQFYALRKQNAVPENGNAVTNFRANHNNCNCGQPSEKDNTRNLLLYALRPLPGKVFTSDLDRKFAAATIYIDLYPDKGNSTAEISGEINYYDHEQYVNAHLVGGIVRTIPLAPQTIPLTLNKPLSISLPHGIHYSVMLTDSQP